jgi:hypothetical protein
MLLPGLLPLAALGLVILLLHRRDAGSAAVVRGTLLWSYGVALASEALGVLHALSFACFLAGWGVVVMALAFALLRSDPLVLMPRRWPAGMWRMRIRGAAAGLIAEEWILAVVLAIVGGTTLLLALVCPPNNSDSQVYHLPRIEH